MPPVFPSLSPFPDHRTAGCLAVYQENQLSGPYSDAQTRCQVCGAGLAARIVDEILFQ